MWTIHWIGFRMDLMSTVEYTTQTALTGDGSVCLSVEGWMWWITGYISPFYRALKNVYPSFLPQWQDHNKHILNCCFELPLFFAEIVYAFFFFSFLLFQHVKKKKKKKPSLLTNSFLQEFQQQEMNVTADSLCVLRVICECSAWSFFATGLKTMSSQYRQTKKNPHTVASSNPAQLQQ